MAAPILSVTNVYLIGKQGCGKSATGNTLLKRKVFPAKASGTAVTTEIHKEGINVNNHQINIWDGPGVTEMTFQTDETVNWLKGAINARKSERHAILWVARYGELCGQEDEYLLKELNKHLGKSFVKDNTVVVVTHKDNFDSDAEDSGLTFSDWVNQQTGFFKKMSSLCGSRVVPINNRSESKEQVKLIFRCVLPGQALSAAASDPSSDFEMIDHPLKIGSSRVLPIPSICSTPAIKQTQASPYQRPAKRQGGGDATMKIKFQSGTDVIMKDERQGGDDVVTKVKQQIEVLTNIFSDTSYQRKLASLEKVRGEVNSCSGIPSEKRVLIEAIIREVDREIEMCRSNISHDQQTRDYLGRMLHLLRFSSHHSAHDGPL